MRDHLPLIIIFAIWLIPGAVWLVIRRFDRRADDPQTGDGINPEALRDWRKAQWRPK